MAMYCRECKRLAILQRVAERGVTTRFEVEYIFWCCKYEEKVQPDNYYDCAEDRDGDEVPVIPKAFIKPAICGVCHMYDCECE